MSQQLDHWRSIHQELTRKLGSSKAQIHISKSLFVLIIGSNDVLDYYGSLELRKTSNPQQYMKSIADKFKEHLKVKIYIFYFILCYYRYDQINFRKLY